MTIDQARQLYRALFVAFPSFRDYLEYKVEDGDATLTAWCEMLSSTDYDHGVEVIHLLKSGERKLPEAYERDRLPLLIKSYAARIAQDQAKDQADEKIAKETLRRRAIKRDSPWQHNLGTLLKESRRAGERLREAEITEAENERIVGELRVKARETKSSSVDAARLDFHE